MKRFLFICLIMLLPFQATWAASASYCQHERETKTHFGHHGHEHKEAKAKGEADLGGKVKIKVHSDCLNCHGASVGLAAEPGRSAQPFVTTAHPLAYADPIQIIASDRPERPKWNLAV